MEQRKKVLLVDDDADFVEMNRAVLQEHGYDVVVAYNGQECMEKVVSEKPDLVVLDLMMGTWSEGLNVAEQLRSSDETSGIPLLLATVVNLEAPYASRPELVCDWLIDEYVMKPVEPEKLVAAVERGLRRKTKRKAPVPAPAEAPVIMLVDDDPDFLEVNRAVLEANGYEVVCARGVGEAMAKMAESRPDLVITDLAMETVLSGISFAQKIRSDQNLREVPVMAVTGLRSQRGFKFAPSEDELAMVGVDRYFEKPVDPQTLLDAVKELTEQGHGGEKQ